MRMIFAFKECGIQLKKRIFSFKEIIRWIGARQTRAGCADSGTGIIIVLFLRFVHLDSFSAVCYNPSLTKMKE